MISSIVYLIATSKHKPNHTQQCALCAFVARYSFPFKALIAIHMLFRREREFEVNACSYCHVDVVFVWKIMAFAAHIQKNLPHPLSLGYIQTETQIKYTCPVFSYLPTNTTHTKSSDKPRENGSMCAYSSCNMGATTISKRLSRFMRLYGNLKISLKFSLKVTAVVHSRGSIIFQRANERCRVDKRT